MNTLKDLIPPLYNFVKKNAGLTLLLAVIACVFVMTRFYDFETHVMFLGDQGRDASIVRKLVTLENLPFIGAPSSIGQVYLGPFYYYLIAPFLPLFAWNPSGLAFGVSIIAIIGSIFGSFIVKKQFGWTTAVVFLTLITLSSTLIDLARFSWNPNLLPYFSFATLYFFSSWLDTQTTRNGILFGLFLGLSMQLHYLMALVLPAFLILFLMSLHKRSVKERITMLRNLVLPIGIFLITMIPLILFDVRHGFINATQLLKLLTDGGLSTSGLPYLARLVETINGLFVNAFTMHIPHAVGILLFSLFLIAGFVLSRRINSRFFTLNLVVVLTYVLGFAYLGSPRLAHYYVPMYLSVYLIIAAIPVIISRKNIALGVAGSIIAIFFLFNMQNYHFLNSHVTNQIQLARQISASFKPHIQQDPIQIVTIPYTESHGHYRYFLEVMGYSLIAEDSSEQANELYVMCFEECIPQDDPQWQIAAFENKKVVEHWRIENVTIYKLIHGTNP